MRVIGVSWEGIEAGWAWDGWSSVSEGTGLNELDDGSSFSLQHGSVVPIFVIITHLSHTIIYYPYARVLGLLWRLLHNLRSQRQSWQPRPASGWFALISLWYLFSRSKAWLDWSNLLSLLTTDCGSEFPFFVEAFCWFWWAIHTSVIIPLFYSSKIHFTLRPQSPFGGSKRLRSQIQRKLNRLGERCTRMTIPGRSRHEGRAKPFPVSVFTWATPWYWW